MNDRGDDFTTRLLVDAGLGPGMRVLDIGCGRGEVSRTVARLLGPSGAVVGLDRDRGALEFARGRAQGSDMAKIDYVEGELAALPPGLGSFDAVIGRRVLMYQADALTTVRALAQLLRTGGVMVLQEHDARMVPASMVPLPLHERVHRWMWETVRREGANLAMGFELHALLEQAGLAVERIRAEAIVQTPKARHHTAMIVRAMLPRMVEHGVATEAEIDVDTLDQRLAQELEAANATYVGDMAFGAWARKPAGGLS